MIIGGERTPAKQFRHLLGEKEGEVRVRERLDDRTGWGIMLVKREMVRFTFHKPQVSKTKYCVLSLKIFAIFYPVVVSITYRNGLSSECFQLE